MFNKIFGFTLFALSAVLIVAEPPVNNNGGGYTNGGYSNSISDYNNALEYDNNAGNNHHTSSDGAPIDSYGEPNYDANDHSGHGEPKAYEFGYQVKDDYTGTNYNRQEKSDGNQVTGSYRVQLPDGRTQIVTYYADWQTGFHADVRYEGEAHYPEQYNTNNNNNNNNVGYPNNNNVNNNDHNNGGYNYGDAQNNNNYNNVAPSNQYGTPNNQYANGNSNNQYAGNNNQYAGNNNQYAGNNNQYAGNQYDYNQKAATSSVTIKDYSEPGSSYTGYNNVGQAQAQDSYANSVPKSKTRPQQAYGAP